MADVERKRVELGPTGVHVLPLMTAPAILSRSADPRLLVVEMTPLDKQGRSEARCLLPMTAEDAVRLAILIAEHALQNNWPLPEGSPIRRTIQ